MSKGKLKEVAMVVKTTVTVMQKLKMPAVEFQSLLRMLEWPDMTGKQPSGLLSTLHH